VVVIASMAIALAATPLAAAVARRTGLLDRPGPLKVQTRAVPYLGGLAVLAAVSAGLAARHPAWAVPLVLALVLGTFDDARELDPRVRLSGEIVVGLTAGAIAPTGLAQPWAALVTAALVVVLINAVNLVDGLDALAAGVTLVAAVGFAIALDGDDRVVALSLTGALAGFLVFNRPPARIYLGDGGAYVLGTALAMLLVRAWRPEDELARPVGALLFVALPVAEVVFAVIRRVRARAPLFIGDRGHLYDQLAARGWPTVAVSGVCAALQAVLVALGLVAVDVATAGAVAIVTVSALALLAGAAAGGFLSPASPRGTA
jgi:UDP-N-acetylmuramyl pentapeptide phosphotransferase/UDP-N-acetylglucosamine-1-phosphate transferase